MTFGEIVRREFAHQSRRVSPRRCFAVLLSASFLLVRGNAVADAPSARYFLTSPFVVAVVTVAGGLLWLLVTSACPASPAVANTCRTQPGNKARQRVGRFLAVFALTALILLAIPAGIALAACAPGAATRSGGPFPPEAYLTACALIALPNIAIATAIQYALTALRGVKRQIASGAMVALAIVAVAALLEFKSITDNGGRIPVKPFRIAGNLYYVGTTDVTAFLLAGPEGHVLIDGGYPGTASLIMENIAALGFAITDVKILLNSHAHFDHAGGLAALQAASGATLWASEGDADAIASGGADDPTLGPLGLLVHAGLVRYPAPRVDRRFADGATIRLGPLELTAHVTAGHTPGCTTWSFPVRDGDRELRAVSVCSLTLPPGLSPTGPEAYPGIWADFERSFGVLRGLPADIFLASHAGSFALERKLRERPDAEDPVSPFIDREGYLDYIDSAEEQYREMLRAQRRGGGVGETSKGATR